MDTSRRGPDRTGPDADALLGIREELRDTREEARELAGGLTDRQLWWRPGEDRWSVGECLDHLVRAGKIYLEALDEAIGAARAAGRTARQPFRPGPVGRWVVRLLEPPPGIRVPAPRAIRPRRREGGAADDEGDEAEAPDPLPRFLELGEQVAPRLAAAQGLDLRRVKFASPFVPLLRVDLGSAFRVIAAHERRHLWQARQVTEAPGFPGD